MHYSTVHPLPRPLYISQARFARVESLGSLDDPEIPRDGGGGGKITTGMEPGIKKKMVQTHGGPLPTVDTSRAVDAPLPSAVAVWSPILALCSFVEPLTSRASALWNAGHFNISFHEQEPTNGGSGSRVGDRALRPSSVATAAVGEAVERGVKAPGGESAVALAAPAGESDTSLSANDTREREAGWRVVTLAAAATGKEWLVNPCSSPLQDDAIEQRYCAVASDGGAGDGGGAVVRAGVEYGLNMDEDEKKEHEDEGEDEDEELTVDLGQPHMVGIGISAV